MSQSNSYPLYFTLEHVNNDFILTSKTETGSLAQEPAYCKEVVAEDKIHARIGQLFHPDALKKELPVVFRIEAATQNTYKSDVEMLSDSLMEAKVAYAHFFPKKNNGENIVALVIADTQTIEVYGLEAERLAKQNNLKTIRVGGIPVLRFPSSKDGRKHLASICPKISILDVSHKDVLQWHAEHQVQLEEIKKKEAESTGK